ncbi:sigma-70 family RNA polymerase sigma factor [Haloferula sp. BvORR071]|uniref:sigma-70 family RNA polymerase sigma factor n=1 Tax=Haloferula sp. BvORR071 TaxID=1396141 RepID=UPI00054D91D6|nr:sigma-70 family RNA polymerase sigma factor [Haloferula sp. BvORR071]
MNALTDQQLLQEYAKSRSESAFRELVRRHIDLVHSAALRVVRNPHTAEDVTQAVFTALAREAGRLSSHPVLAGWLHRTTRHLSTNSIRSDARRRSREQQAIAMNEQAAHANEGEPAWAEIAPHLDAVLGELSESDRDAILLRFFEKRSAKEIAAQLGISAESAQKRVNRAVERLRELFARRGVSVSAGVLTVAIPGHAVQAAPVALAGAVSAAVLAGPATTLTATSLIMKMLIPIATVFLAGAWLLQNREADRLRAEIAVAVPKLPSSGGRLEGEAAAAPMRAESKGVGRTVAPRAGFSVGAGVEVDGEQHGMDLDPKLVGLDNLGRPTTDAVERLELTDGEIAALEAAVRRVREEASADFVARVKLTGEEKKADGYHYYYQAPARPDRGQHFFEELSKAFVTAIGEVRGTRFRAAMPEDEFLGGMGKYDLEFDLYGPTQNNIGVVKCVSREPGSDKGGGSFTGAMDSFEERFGKVFDFPEEGGAAYPKLPIRTLPQGR